MERHRVPRLAKAAFFALSYSVFMGRRQSQRQPYSLDCGDVTSLPREEIRLVIRAADDLIARGGRTLLRKILRGSAAQDVLPEHLANPAYGCWRELPETLVSQRVDWCIQQGYLELEYFGKLPLLVFPPKGLVIAIQLIATEWRIEAAFSNGFSKLEKRLADAPLPTLLALLDQIADSRDERFRPFLQAWSEHGTKRLKARIRAIEAEWNGSGPRRRSLFEVCWIDESLGNGAVGSFLEYAKGQTILCGEMRWIAEVYPSLPDVEIYRNLLRDQSACLLTSDRPFHNALCEQRISSFFVHPDGQIDSTPLPGVEPRGILAKLGQQAPPDSPPSAPENERDGHPFYPLVAPESPVAQKKLRTKRRRIRNYFGGIGHMGSSSLTITMRPAKQPLIGIRLRIVAANTGVKALDATEMYFRERSGDRLGAYIQAAALLIQLGIAEVPVEIYFDSRVLPPPDTLEQSPGFPFWQALRTSLGQVSIKAIGERPRSPRMDDLRSKLTSLGHGPTNEIVEADSLALAKRWESIPF